MTYPHETSSIFFPPFPHPFVTISTRQTLLQAQRHFAGQPFTAVSPPHAGASLGIDWWLHVTKGLSCPSVLDCGASASLALEALHRGITGVICRDFRAGLPADMKDRLFSQRPPCEDRLALKIM
ncbi:hypothetical protein NQF87_06495 [Bombella sp. TMW 2.2559]|uniref:Nucleoside phosphorylase domain-containing protein n=1 Tax=Bombella dulcis TaxID=2967339 RepID=A0ABT3WC02_9PROT|nr:hypothetical protein [Bombella dulcis]MCX5616617.1 hypothetical protein [Bombella dulcis]